MNSSKIPWCAKKSQTIKGRIKKTPFCLYPKFYFFILMGLAHSFLHRRHLHAFTALWPRHRSNIQMSVFLGLHLLHRQWTPSFFSPHLRLKFSKLEPGVRKEGWTESWETKKVRMGKWREYWRSRDLRASFQNL